MLIKTAEFVKSSTTYKLCPEKKLPEYAFIGRSNVGKSSLLNMLTNKSKLAKISSKPGKTQTINHFIINDSWFLVDLPGYGYAQISKKERVKWEKFVVEYIIMRENLHCLFILIDSRLEPQKIDLEFMELMAINSVPFALIFTKIDKKSKGAVETNIENYKNLLLKTWAELPAILITSSVTEFGKEEILNFIEDVTLKIEKQDEQSVK